MPRYEGTEEEYKIFNLRKWFSSEISNTEIYLLAISILLAFFWYAFSKWLRRNYRFSSMYFNKNLKIDYFGVNEKR